VAASPEKIGDGGGGLKISAVLTRRVARILHGG